MHAKGAGASEKGARRAKVGATISPQFTLVHATFIRQTLVHAPSHKAANSGGNSNSIATQ